MFLSYVGNLSREHLCLVFDITVGIQMCKNLFGTNQFDSNILFNISMYISIIHNSNNIHKYY